MDAMAPLESLDPIRISNTKPANGSAGINQICENIRSTPHPGHGIRVQCLETVIELEHQRQSHRDLGSCHCQYENEHYLPIGLLPSGTSYDKGQSCGIQHHLDGHEDENRVPPNQKSKRA
jgi:hypothetical protein